MIYTAWQLRALKGKTVELTLSNWMVKRWIITVNMFDAVHLMCSVKDWAYLLASTVHLNSQEVNIKSLIVVDDFTEWEEVYVSDISVEDALNNRNSLFFICTTSSWRHIVQWGSWYRVNADTWFSAYKYISKIPKEEPVEEMTMEQVNKALGKKIKIIE